MMETETAIRGILSAWTDLNVSRAGDAWVIAGRYNGKAHAGGRIDGVSLAEDLQRIAEAEDAPRPIAPPIADDEDEGQPAASEIFTEEDVEEYGIAAANYSGETAEADGYLVPGEASGPDARPSDSVSGGDGDVPAEAGLRSALENLGGEAPAAEAASEEIPPPRYPGIAFLENELERRRNQVFRMISDARRNRMMVAGDKSREDWLAEQAQRYISLGALGSDIPEETQRAYAEFCELKERREAIQREALQREDATAVADMDQLKNIATGIDKGWPT